MRALHILIAVLCAGPVLAQDETPRTALRGRVVDAQTGEPLSRAVVLLPALHREASTEGDGTFTVADVPAGDVEIVVSTVGYGLVTTRVRAGADSKPVEIRLGQEALKRSEELRVEASPFDPADAAAPAAHTLGGVELRNLSSVLIDDPLRSVQSLPGVATGDDFYASFASRGLGFGAVGFYLDGVLMSAPFHTILDANDTYSLTILNGDVVEAVSLVSGGAPARYGDRIGAVLDVTTREGSRDGFAGRASLGASGAYATLEGPLGGKTTWLVSGRRSYLDYVLEQVDVEAGTVVRYYDFTGKVVHRPAASQTVALTMLHGRSHWKDGETDLDPLDVATADVEADLATLRWTYLPSEHFRIDSSAFGTYETGHNNAKDGTERFRSKATQWGGRTDVLRSFGAHRIEAGALVRSLRGDQHDFDRRNSVLTQTESYDASTLQWGGYVQDTWTPFGGRLAVSLGGRFDADDETRAQRFMPRASASVSLTSRTRAFATFGDYAQFPGFTQLHGENGNPDLAPERARHLTFAVEQRLGERSRVRVEAYQQDEEELIFSRELDLRLENGRITGRSADARLGNTLDGRVRGLEVLLQRRSANGVSGWVAYAYSHARRTERATGLRFDSDFDQRHTLTAYASVRASRTLNLSVKYRYGSGFPVPGFIRPVENGIVLSDTRNELRADPYSRLDLRANKTWIFRSWKLTLFAEVLNALNHENTRNTGLEGINPRTGRVTVGEDTLFPILPSVGVTVDF